MSLIEVVRCPFCSRAWWNNIGWLGYWCHCFNCDKTYPRKCFTRLMDKFIYDRLKNCQG